LVQAAKDRNRPIDLSDIEVKGETIEDLAVPHGWEFIYKNNNTLPLSYAKAGIGGIKYRKYDETMCTYCSFFNGVILMAIKEAWKGKDFDNIEILTGALRQAGIRAPSYIFKNIKMAPLLFLGKYKGKPEFQEHFYQIN
jgi:hypothetical protein